MVHQQRWLSPVVTASWCLKGERLLLLGLARGERTLALIDECLETRQLSQRVGLKEPMHGRPQSKSWMKNLRVMSEGHDELCGEIVDLCFVFDKLIVVERVPHLSCLSCSHNLNPLDFS